MRLAGAILLASSLALPAFVGLLSQQNTAQAKAAPVAQPGRDVYPNIPLPERVSIQFDLAWSGHYNGLINGEFNDKSIAAVRTFQRDYKFKETGILAPPERTLLATLSKARQDQVGWRMVDDRVTGTEMGIP